MKVTDPHHDLGLHEQGHVIRLWRPGTEVVQLEVNGEFVNAKQGEEKGIFEYRLSHPIALTDYRIYYPNGTWAHDPYAFLPTFSTEDEKLFEKGQHWTIYEVMGGRVCIHQGCVGTKFSVWAPCARSVSLVGNFNQWDPYLHPMRLMGSSGVWELFLPGIKKGEMYKFVIQTEEGELLYKADPYAFQGEMRPQTASVLTDVDSYDWKDHTWMEKREVQLDQPLNIYEVHLGSWKRGSSAFLNYREIALELAEYVKKMRYTHVEILPIMGHPLDESWGYQLTGFYAISRRFGEVEDFQYFVDVMHDQGIGVILDWVPGHFPTDEHSVAQFDGTCLYEHIDPKQGYHPQWETHIFNYGRHEVSNFLIGSALFYCDKMHVDGFRVDAVSSMVYLDFERKEGEWIPNIKGGNENLEAIAFLKTLNRLIKEKHRGVLMIAEESHAYPGVTDPQGLGFDLKWNLGWMHDTLRYFETPLEDRPHKQHLLVHEFTYYFDEKTILPLSHDEVVHEKKSLLSKMPGNEWEKFANLRLLLSYMICHPGKKLLFMGGDIGQWLEWNCGESVHWDVLQMPFHQKLQNFVRALNTFYLQHGALWEEDFTKKGWQWVDYTDETNTVLSYRRKGKESTLLCIHHFSVEQLENYYIPYKGANKAQEIFSTDSQEYGGYGILNADITVEKEGLRLSIPPLSTLIIRV